MEQVRRELKPEQRQAIYHGSGDILVSAAAGSGKTFVMIERIIRLITEGKANVHEILAATFTEAAAADMKEKLKKALSFAVENGNVALAEQLAAVSTADICTLHGFCARLCRTYFFAAGVAPDFKVISESEADALKQESLDRVFKSFYEEKDADFLAVIDRYRKRRKDDMLKGIVKDISEFCESELYPENLLSAYLQNYTEEGAEKFTGIYGGILRAAAKGIAVRAEKLCADCRAAGFTDGEKIAENLKSVALEIEKTGVAAAIKAAESGFIRITPKKPPEGQEYLKTELSDIKSAVKGICEYSLKTAIDASLFPALKENARALNKIVTRYSEKYAELKKDAGALDFGDLERFALKALSDDSVRQAVRKKYKFVFVDEFQDVNGVQEGIISAVSDGNLFMVGDAKQSIYGFRGCRAEIFENREKEISAQGGTALRLNYNFRSAKKVIDFINEIFSFCYIPEYTGLDYANTSSLKEGGIYPAGAEGRAQLHLLLKGKKPQKEREEAHVYDLIKEAYKVEEKETASVSNLIAEIIDGELLREFYDLKTGAMRRVTMKDIAILTRSGDSAFVKGIVEGLNAHGISAVSNVTENVCDFPEIKTLINALKLIDNFKQDAPLAGTLLSEIGGFSEEDLSAIAIFASDAGKRLNFSDAFELYLNEADTELCQRLKKFKKYFDGVRFTAHFKGAKGVIRKLCFDCGYENCLLASDDGERKLRRYYKFLSEADGGGKRRTVREFLARVNSSRKAFEFSFGGAEDAVTVMTMHSSKGLEFPVVIVCGLEKTFNRSDERKAVIRDRDLGFFAEYFDDKTRTVKDTGFRAIVNAKARVTQLKEEMRLFYVAATRAEYSLHLIAEVGADDRRDRFSDLFVFPSNYFGFIPSSIPVAVHLPESFGLVALKRSGRKVLVGKPDLKSEAKMRKDFAFSYPFAQDTVLPLKNNVTAAVKDKKEDFYPVYTVFSDGSTKTESGIAAHKIMQFIDFNKDFYAEIERLKRESILTREELDTVNIDRIYNVFRSGVFGGLNSKTLYREQDFIVNIPANRVFKTDSGEEVLLQGVIDLLAVDGETAEIIDYKYSALSGESLKRAYREQLSLYAYAAEKSLGVKVMGKTLVNLFTGETVSAD